MTEPRKPAGPKMPVFVYGALRSGTTVFRIMLNHHPDLSNPGEMDFLFDHIARDDSHPTGWRYDLEALRSGRIFRGKGIDLPAGPDGRDLLDAMIAGLMARSGPNMTLNLHRNAEKMAALFPEAKVIHLIRDPRDVARSLVGRGRGGNSYFGVQHWIETEQSWDRAEVPRAQVLTLSFETLMSDIEGELDRVCTFLGVPFSAAMLDYHHHTNYGPPDPRIAQQWRRNAAPREIARIEALAAPLMAARGYEPSGTPVMPGFLEHALLAIDHRLRRWRFNIRKFGLPLFLARHASHVLGLKGWQRKVNRMWQDVQIRNLK